MVRFSNLSVLRRLDLDNTKSVQKVLDILAATLQRGSTTIEKKTVSGHKLTVMESQWTDAILRAIERNKEYPLLARAILRLCAARKESVVRLNIAIQELEDLAEEDVLIVPESHEEEYVAAVAKFKEMHHSKNQTLMEESYILALEAKNKPRGTKRKHGESKVTKETPREKYAASGLASQKQAEAATTSRNNRRTVREQGVEESKPEVTEYKARSKGACTTCRQAKIRCNAMDTSPKPCSTCVKRGKECIYEPSHK